MIQPAKYNGINFTSSFLRESPGVNFAGQRSKSIINKKGFRYLSFYCTDVVDETTAELSVIFDGGVNVVTPEISNGSASEWVFYFNILSADLPANKDVRFSVKVDDSVIYSEIYTVRDDAYCSENEISEIVGYNDDDRHGLISNESTIFVKMSRFKSDIFLSKTVNYEYSYSRKMILSSENSIAKRFTFLNLTAFEQNALKWLCNCENLYIDNVKHYLISDFSELNNDENTELVSLRADFIPVDQSFFTEGAATMPIDIFPKYFFTK